MLTPLERSKLEWLRTKHPDIHTPEQAIERLEEAESLVKVVCPGLPQWLECKMAVRQMYLMIDLLGRADDTIQPTTPQVVTSGPYLRHPIS